MYFCIVENLLLNEFWLVEEKYFSDLEDKLLFLKEKYGESNIVKSDNILLMYYRDTLEDEKVKGFMQSHFSNWTGTFKEEK